MHNKDNRFFYNIMRPICALMISVSPQSNGPELPPLENINLLNQTIQESNGDVEPIVFFDKDLKSACSGTKINDQILTLRHCFKEIPFVDKNPKLLSPTNSPDSVILVSTQELKRQNVIIAYRSSFQKGDSQMNSFQSEKIKLDTAKPFCNPNKVNWNRVYLNGFRTNSQTNSEKPLYHNEYPGNSGAGVFYKDPHNKNNQYCLIGPYFGNEIYITSLFKKALPVVYVNMENSFTKMVVKDQEHDIIHLTGEPIIKK
jgi:hypothetical protein